MTIHDTDAHQPGFEVRIIIKLIIGIMDIIVPIEERRLDRC